MRESTDRETKSRRAMSRGDGTGGENGWVSSSLTHDWPVEPELSRGDTLLQCHRNDCRLVHYSFDSTTTRTGVP